MQVILSVAEHHSNLVPWQMVAQKTGAVLKHVRLTPGTQELDMQVGGGGAGQSAASGLHGSLLGLLGPLAHFCLNIVAGTTQQTTAWYKHLGCESRLVQPTRLVE